MGTSAPPQTVIGKYCINDLRAPAAPFVLHHTVQTVDLILPRIQRIPKMHSCIEKKNLPQWLCCIVRTFQPPE